MARSSRTVDSTQDASLRELLLLAAVERDAGYNLRVLLVIAMNAFGGLLCAVMLKYAGLASQGPWAPVVLLLRKPHG